MAWYDFLTGDDSAPSLPIDDYGSYASAGDGTYSPSYSYSQDVPAYSWDRPTDFSLDNFVSSPSSFQDTNLNQFVAPYVQMMTSGQAMDSGISPESSSQLGRLISDNYENQGNNWQVQEAPSKGIWDTLNEYGKKVDSPAGKLLTGLGGAGIGAFGAWKQNKLLKEAAAKKEAMLAQRQAANATYNAPLRLAFGRAAEAGPTARRGETAFFSNNKLPSYFAEGGLAGYVEGGSAGQEDMIEAQLSDGEYVLDADIVSALGDGNNEAGAARLDQMREAIRRHKRAAPDDEIPPKALPPLAYLKGAK